MHFWYAPESGNGDSARACAATDMQKPLLSIGEQGLLKKRSASPGALRLCTAAVLETQDLSETRIPLGEVYAPRFALRAAWLRAGSRDKILPDQNDPTGAYCTVTFAALMISAYFSVSLSINA